MTEQHNMSRALFFGENLIGLDVAITDPKGRLRVAIEIKGSMDKAGAQARLIEYCGYGEARCSQTEPCQVVPFGSRIRPR